MKIAASATETAADLRAVGPTASDVVVGLAASGRTPYLIGGLDYARGIAIDRAGPHAKTAVVMLLADVERPDAIDRLQRSGGSVRAAVEAQRVAARH